MSAVARRRIAHHDRAVIAALAGAGIVGSFMQTILTPVFPLLPEALGADLGDTSWVLTATLLAAGVTTPITGRLADMVGRRRVHLALLVVLFIGSLVSAMAGDLPTMLLGRVLQGVGLGVVPLGISILRSAVRPERLTSGIATVSATLGVGGAVAVPVAAAVAQVSDWRVLFWMSAGLTVVSFLSVVFLVPSDGRGAGGRFDVIGAMGLATGLVGVLLGVSGWTRWGWASPVTWVSILGGLVVLVLWGVFELRVADPLIDLRVMARRPVLVTNLAAVAFGFTFFMITATMPLILESPPSEGGMGLGLPLIIGGLCLAPSGLVMFAVSPFGGRTTTRHGPRTSMLIGAACVLLAMLLGVLAIPSVLWVVGVGLVLGVGIGFAYGAMPAVIVSNVPAEETAAAISVNTVLRTFGSACAGTIWGAILVVQTGPSGAPMIDGVRLAYLIGSGVALVAVGLSLTIPSRQRSGQAHSVRLPVEEPG